MDYHRREQSGIPLARTAQMPSTCPSGRGVLEMHGIRVETRVESALFLPIQYHSTIACTMHLGCPVVPEQYTTTSGSEKEQFSKTSSAVFAFDKNSDQVVVRETDETSAGFSAKQA